jgi:F0F1-type ATP synthase assembly protein I
MRIHPEGSSGTKARIHRAFRITMAWQAAACGAIAAVAGVAAGWHGLLSAMLGGGIGLTGVLVFALVSRRSTGSSSSAVRIALRAEGAKVLVIVVLLWLAFVVYRDMVVLAFLGAFVVSVLLSGLAFAVSGDQLNSSRV